MFFGLTDDQQAMGRAVADLVAGRFGPGWVRARFDEQVSADPPSGHDTQLWAAMAEQGWLAVTVPEEHDGLGLGLVDAAVVALELGAATLPGPWRGTVLAAEALRTAGSPEQQATWLPRLAAGEAVGAVSLETAAPGRWPRVEHADVADLLLLGGGGGGGDLHLVTGPVPAQRRTTLDGTTALWEVEVPDGGPTLPRGDLADRAAVLVAADLAGMARRWLERTVEHDTAREQFGRPVGSFQAIKHHLADLHTATTMSRLAVLAAAHLLDVGDPGASLAASVAKAKASDTALAVTAAAVQYHGGIGYTWEHDAHIAFKRARRLAFDHGSADQHRERIATLTLDPPA